MSIELKDQGDLRGLKATVMGLGLNGGGLACARFLVERGAIVTVTDTKDESALASTLADLEGLPIRYVLGRHEMADFSEADIVVKNPAVRPDSPFLAAARSIETDISLFLRFARSPVIAVTGSKGKSSVSTAINYCLQKSGYSSLLGGNITVSPLSFIDRCSSSTPVVLELSSWQLADIKGKNVLKPKVAVLTGIMPDHMNRYSSMEEYVADKRIIYESQDESCYTICNRDDSWGRSFASQTRGSVLWYSDADRGFPGAWMDHDQGDIGLYSPSGSISESEEILPSRIAVPGKHQRKNMLCAALACRAYGAGSRAIREAIADFPGVEHRLEKFAENNGIAWYNDSAATIPQAVAAALDSFSERIILITGGTDKNLDFSPVREAYRKAASIILLSGTGTEKLIPILSDLGLRYSGPFGDLDLAIREAIELARPGDIVLLSPGCTSFGMFLHEFDRGRKFKDTVLSYLKQHSRD